MMKILYIISNIYLILFSFSLQCSAMNINYRQLLSNTSSILLASLNISSKIILNNSSSYSSPT